MRRKRGWEQWPLSGWLAIAGCILTVGGSGAPFLGVEHLLAAVLAAVGAGLFFVAVFLFLVESHLGRRL